MSMDAIQNWIYDLPTSYSYDFVSLCTIIVAIHLGKWVIKFVSSRLDRFASHYIPHPESLLKKYS